MNAQENTSKFKNILAIAGFVLLLIVGIWSAVQVIKFVPRIFSSDGVSDRRVSVDSVGLEGKDIAIQIDKTLVQSGVPVEIKWAHTGDENGALSFSYACIEGFYFQIGDVSVTCNEPYELNVSDTQLTVIPLSVKKLVEVPLAITYTNAAGNSIRDTKTLVIDNSTIIEEEPATEEETNTEDSTNGPIEPDNDATTGPVEPEQPTTSVPETNQDTPSVQIPLTSNPYGIADLEVQMVGVGEINQFGSFEPKTVLRPYARGAAKFKVSNLGDKHSGSWYFTAFLPSRGGYPFTSQPQASLMPGASVEISITFDQLVPGTRTFSVQIDPLNYIPESSEMNNSTGQNITVLQY